MDRILQIGASVGTPLGLLGLIATLCYYLYARRLKHQGQVVHELPPKERARIVDQQLTRYGIDGSKATADQKLRLIQDEMDKRYRLSRLYLLVFAVVFVLCFGLSIYAFVVSGQQVPPTKGDHSETKLTGSKDKRYVMTLSLHRVSATGREEGVTHQIKKEGETDGGLPDEALKEASVELAALLKEKYVSTLPEGGLTVSGKIASGPDGKRKVEFSPNEPEVRACYWRITDRMLKEHFPVEMASELLAESHGEVWLEFARPGCDLGLISISNSGQVQLKTPVLIPLVVVAFEDIPQATASLHNHLIDSGLDVQEFSRLNDYKQVLDKGLLLSGGNVNAKLAKLRETRVDFTIRPTFVVPH